MTKKLEQEIAKRERQIARVNHNLEEMEGDTAIKAIIRKVAEMERDLESLRTEVVAERRRNQSPPIRQVKEKDVLVELNELRDVLLSDVGAAAPVLKALVGDGRRRERRQSGQPFEPKYRQLAAEVDRRRKAGEGFDRLARELKVSRGRP